MVVHNSGDINSRKHPKWLWTTPNEIVPPSHDETGATAARVLLAIRPVPCWFMKWACTKRYQVISTYYMTILIVPDSAAA